MTIHIFPFDQVVVGTYLYKRPSWENAGEVDVILKDNKLFVQFGVDNSPVPLTDIPDDVTLTETIKSIPITEQ